MSDGFDDFLLGLFGQMPNERSLFEQAVSHSSADGRSYERLEFLGDRVLGLVIARWLFERFPNEPEGKLSSRLNALVARETCAEIGRAIDLPPWIRLGRQARDDRANQSDNVIGDVVEALIGALLLDSGMDHAEQFVRAHWGPLLDQQRRAPQHPKSTLQELAAARGHKPPAYETVGRTGAHHSPVFTVRVTVPGLGEAEAQGSSKQEAEKAAAAALLEQVR